MAEIALGAAKAVIGKIGLGTIVTAGATLAGIRQQKKAAGLARRREQILANQSRRRAVREARKRRATGIAVAQARGAGGSSPVSGGIGSLGSNLFGQIGTSNALSGLNHQIAGAQSRANTFQSVAQLGPFVGGLFQQQEEFNPVA